MTDIFYGLAGVYHQHIDQYVCKYEKNVKSHLQLFKLFNRIKAGS